MELPDGELRAALHFWFGPDGPPLFEFGGPGIGAMMNFANGWRACQVYYVGEFLILVALFRIWRDIRAARAYHAAESDSTAPISEKIPH